MIYALCGGGQVLHAYSTRKAAQARKDWYEARHGYDDLYILKMPRD